MATSKYKSRAGVEVEAYQVTKEEKLLQVRTDEGMENLKPGDALVTLNKKSFRVRAELFEAVFGNGGKSSEEEKPKR